MLGHSGSQNESEARLEEGIRARDPRALEALYTGHAAMVHGLALRIVQDSATAEEITQDVFVYVWQHADRFDPSRGNLLSWLVTLVRSRSIDRLRARSSQQRRIEGLAREAATERPTSANPLEDVLGAERGVRVRRALATLSREQRQALEIAYFEGLSHSEIAARLGDPLGTIKTRIRQGLIRLRAALDERGS